MKIRIRIGFVIFLLALLCGSDAFGVERLDGSNLVDTTALTSLELIEPESAPASAIVAPKERSPWALRTNLLLDIVGGANLGAEVPLGEHFSVAADVAYAYTRINNLYALQTIQGDVEARYWFSPRTNVLTGWNVGVYAMYSSRFDVQWGGGYQGDGFFSAGLSAGYAVALSPRFNMDFSVMGGYFYSPEVRQYARPKDGHLMWEKTTYNMHRILPVQARVSLIWFIR